MSASWLTEWRSVPSEQKGQERKDSFTLRRWAVQCTGIVNVRLQRSSKKKRTAHFLRDILSCFQLTNTHRMRHTSPQVQPLCYSKKRALVPEKVVSFQVEMLKTFLLNQHCNIYSFASSGHRWSPRNKNGHILRSCRHSVSAHSNDTGSLCRLSLSWLLQGPMSV